MIKFKTKIIIISVLINLVLVYFLTQRKEVVKIKTVTKTKIIPVTKSAIDTKPFKVEPKTITILNQVTKTDTIYKNVETQKYTFKDTLSNGIIESIILSDKIYKRDVKLTTFDKHTTKEVTNTIVQSKLFLGGELSTDTNYRLFNAEVKLIFNNKNKYLLSAGIGYNLVIERPIYSLGVAIPIF